MPSFEVAALLGFRLTGLVWIAPIFSGRFVSTKIKIGVLCMLVLLLLPVAQSHAAAYPVISPAAVMGELVIGLTIGLAAAVLVAAAETAGDVLSIQTGLSGATVVDPMNGQGIPTVGQFLGLVALMIFLIMDGHHVILQALARTLEVVPVGQAIGTGAGFEEVARIGAVLLQMGVQIAAPVIGALVMSNASLGVVARTVPQLNVLMMAFPVQIALGLTILGVSLPVMATSMQQWPDMFDGLISWILGADIASAASSGGMGGG